MQLTRRGILKTAMAAPLAFVPHVAVGATWRRHLVLVELNGGNDGLNTVVPFVILSIGRCGQNWRCPPIRC